MTTKVVKTAAQVKRGQTNGQVRENKFLQTIASLGKRGYTVKLKEIVR